MKTIEEEMETTEEKSSNFIDFYIPAVAICLGSIIIALIQVLSVLLLSYIDLMLLVDGIIAGLLLLLLSQMIGAPIVYYGLISFFKVKESEYHPITMNSFGLAFGITGGAIVLIGLYYFIRFLKKYPLSE